MTLAAPVSFAICRARRAGGARDHDDVSLLDASDVCHAEVGRHAGDPEETQGDRGRDARGQALHRALALVGDHVVLPAGHPEQEIAGRVAVGVALQHLGDAAAANHFVDLDRRQVARCVVHPRADRRIDRQVAHARERLSGAGLRYALLLDADGRLVDHPRRTLCQDQTAVALGHADHPLSLPTSAGPSR
jgi:hypothetical protein